MEAVYTCGLTGIQFALSNVDVKIYFLHCPSLLKKEVIMDQPNDVVESHIGECCTVHDKKDCCRKPSYQAYQILHFAFAILPILVGLDKFFNVMTVWSQYLSPHFNFFGNPVTTMMVVGAIEIIVGLGIWFKPRIFAYILAFWLLGIIINLLLLNNFYDIAARDFGLMLGALALARLSHKYDCCDSGKSNCCADGKCDCCKDGKCGCDCHRKYV